MPANTSPILLFTYNRPDHTRRTLEALCANRLAEKSSLFIYCDGPKKDSSPEQLQRISDVRKIVRETPWPGKLELIEREANLGLAESVIRGVTATTSAFGSAIVLEDDIVTSPAFLEYMNFALRHFKDSERVGSVNGWMRNIPPRLLPPYFFQPGGDCWGWATWKRAWKLFEPDSEVLIQELEKNVGIRRHYDNRWMDILRAQARGEVSSWHIRWNTSLIVNGKVGLFPARSYVFNIGNEGSGTHRVSADQGQYRYHLNEGKNLYYIQSMQPKASRYANEILNLDRKRTYFQARLKDHIAYRYPSLARRMGMLSNSNPS